LRISVAQLDGADVGYILGGVRNGRYRGLQLSYVESAQHLSVSHLLQLSEIKQLCENGVDTYDMGMDMEYKRRWSDQEETSVVLVLDRT
jgi:CelD/BcsL family acetyltransferase involved in cellulose biosynthesis